MLINDHINFTGDNPLIGAAFSRYESLTRKNIGKWQKVAAEQNIDLKEGVYGLFWPDI